MGNKERSFFKSSDVRGFLFFLLLTSIVAVLIKLSKSYKKTYDIPIVITEVPLDKTVRSISPLEVEFDAEISGFSLLLHSFDALEIPIEFVNLDSISATRYSYDTGRLNTVLKEVVTGAKEFSSFRTKTIEVTIAVLSTKKVPVQIDVHLDFKSGYDTYNEAVIVPDSVTAVGPQAILEQLKWVKTKKQDVTNISDNVNLSLALDTLSLYKELSLSHNRFTYTQEVAKFTEGSFSIPVTVKGMGEDDVKIFPKEVVLFFVANLEEYDSILASDFEVVADLSTRSDNNEFVVLTIERQPSNVRNVRLRTKQIKFIVVN